MTPHHSQAGKSRETRAEPTGQALDALSRGELNAARCEGATRDLPTATSRVVFGSADSRDRDVLYVVNQLPNPVECKRLCSSDPAENRNLVVIKDGCVAETYKGLPDETNNALLATYNLHTQEDNNPVTQAVVRNAPLKLVRAVRVVLSHLTDSPYREQIKLALRSLNVTQRHQTLSSIDFSRLELSPETQKTIAFQLAQTSALISGQELYTKKEIQEAFPALSDLVGRRGGTNQALNDIRDALLDQIEGVYIRQKGSLNLFMYGNALAIDDWNQYARQCRGMVIDVARERCVLFPMDKFFRFGEGPELTRDALNPSMAVEVVEKVDGSMVSLIAHEGRFQFSCKGNFDTEQSAKALEIAATKPIHLLNTDRYNHVFEVIYPENRFPRGLSIVDYADRQDLVLTAMRDRVTNRLLPYAEVVREAQRVGLSHPQVFNVDLPTAFAEVDSAPRVLGSEGFVIRSLEDGKCYKLKYPAYKRVLELVNDMRSNRFVRDYVAMTPQERENTLSILPKDIQAVALAQLAQHQEIVQKLQEFAERVSRLAPTEAHEFARFVLRNVESSYQKIVFNARKGANQESLLARLAVGIYDQKIGFPSLAKETEE